MNICPLPIPLIIILLLLTNLTLVKNISGLNDRCRAQREVYIEIAEIDVETGTTADFMSEADWGWLIIVGDDIQRGVWLNDQTHIYPNFESTFTTFEDTVEIQIQLWERDSGITGNDDQFDISGYIGDGATDIGGNDCPESNAYVGLRGASQVITYNLITDSWEGDSLGNSESHVWISGTDPPDCSTEDVLDAKMKIGVSDDYKKPQETNQPPNAKLLASKITVNISEIITFDASGSNDPDGSIVKYHFDFGDGENSGWITTPTVTYSYSTEGNYQVTLGVKDNKDAADVDIITIIVEGKPTNGGKPGEVSTDFNPLEDGFSFDNPGWTLSCFYLSFEEAKTILLSDEYYIYLDEGPTSAFKYWFVYLFAKMTHKYGHCYGMCALSMNYYNGFLHIPGGLNPYELSYNQVASDIEYYHNWQLLNVSTFSILQTWGAVNSPINDENQWEIIQTSIRNGMPIIIGLQSDIGRHAVIGYALNEDGDVLIYDSSDPANKQNPINVIDVKEYNSDVSIQYQWDDGTTFDSWVALSYEQAGIIEWYFDSLMDSLWFKADCPLELQILDKYENEVGVSLSDGETHLVVIQNPSNQDYKVKLTGTGDGRYNLTITRSYRGEIKYQNSTGIIKSGDTNEYEVSVKDGEIGLKEVTPSEKGGLSLLHYLIIGIVVVIIIIIIVLIRVKGQKRAQ